MLLEIITFVIIGLVGGVIGGMGMGGGTLLIPLLTIFSGVEQHMAQAINLIAFIPTAVVALIVHIKNKLVEKQHILIVSIPAVTVSVLASLLSRAVDGKSLSVYFGIFLGILGIYQLVTSIITTIKQNKEKKERKKQ